MSLSASKMMCSMLHKCETLAHSSYSLRERLQFATVRITLSFLRKNQKILGYITNRVSDLKQVDLDLDPCQFV